MKKYIELIITAFVGMCFGAMLVRSSLVKRLEIVTQQIVKFEYFYRILVKWLMLKQNNISLSDHLIRKGVYRVAIYGLAELGECLYNELKDTEVKVVYCIDRNAGKKVGEIKTLTPDCHMEDVDTIIVTAVYYFDEIKENLQKKTNARIVSLEDLIYELEYL